MTDATPLLSTAATPFWDALWPNLASTLVGTAIGIPVGLFINRRAVWIAERRSLSAENKLIKRSLNALDSALQYNTETLRLLVDKNRREAQKLVKPLDTGTWDAVRPLLPPSFHEPDLLRRLAYHWVQLGQVTAMHHMILQQQLAANFHPRDFMLAAMQRECDQWFEDLHGESVDLSKALKRHLSKLSFSG